jgi:hypothetical protein
LVQKEKVCKSFTRTYSFLEALHIYASFQEILSRSSERTLIKFPVFYSFVDLNEGEMGRIEWIVVMLASILLEAQFILKIRSFSERLYIIPNGKCNNPFIVSFSTVVGIVSEQDDLDFVRAFLFRALVQVVLVPHGSFSNRSVISIV